MHSQRILLVRLGSLGDIVHAIPVAAALRRAFPSAGIDWLVRARHREILDLVPIIGRRLVVDSRPVTLVGALRELRRGHYDVAIDLQGLVKSAVLAWSSGARRVIGFARSYLREPLARSFYTDIHDPGGGGLFDPGETRHVVLMNLGLLQPLGVSAEGAPEFPIGPVSSSVARAMSERSGGHYTLLNPGAAWPNKRWPASRLGEVAFALRERYGLMSVVVWGTGERPLAEELALHSGGAAIVSPPTSVADLVALARGAALVVSADTGPLHVAAAVGAPVVGIFGPTRPARNGPWSPRDVCVSRADACRCHHARRCRLGTPCLEDIQVDEVLAAIAERLNGANQAISGPPRDSREPLRSAEALSTSGGAS